MTQYIREPFNALSHLVGAILSVIGLFAMVLKVAMNGGSGLQLGAVMMFGLCLILLYSASTAYHMAVAKDRVIALLRKFDHAMIFALIAGSYAPFCLIALNGKIGWTVFSIVTVVAVSGILFKMIWFRCPRWLSTALYIGLGWIIVMAIVPLSSNLGASGLFLLIFGGLLYTIGGVIYGLKPKFLEFKHLGFHEFFHLFIIAGSLCHFFSVYYFVI